jgi:hypothetical protein
VAALQPAVVPEAVGAGSDVVEIAKMRKSSVGDGILAGSGINLDAVAAAAAIELVACAEPVGRRGRRKSRPGVDAAAPPGSAAASAAEGTSSRPACRLPAPAAACGVAAAAAPPAGIPELSSACCGGAIVCGQAAGGSHAAGRPEARGLQDADPLGPDLHGNHKYSISVGLCDAASGLTAW